MKNKYKKTYQFSEDILLALGRTGVILEDHIKQHFNVCNNTIAVLKDSQFIDKGKIYCVKYGLKNYIRLSHEGYRYVKNELGLKYVYRTSISQVLHDIKLNDFYCSLDYKMRNTWITETEIHLDIINGKKEGRDIIGSIDGAYLDGKELIGVEVISKNYSSNEIHQKHLAAETIGCSKLLLIKL